MAARAPREADLAARRAAARRGSASSSASSSSSAGESAGSVHFVLGREREVNEEELNDVELRQREELEEEMLEARLQREAFQAQVRQDRQQIEDEVERVERAEEIERRLFLQGKLMEAGGVGAAGLNGFHFVNGGGSDDDGAGAFIYSPRLVQPAPTQVAGTAAGTPLRGVGSAPALHEVPWDRLLPEAIGDMDREDVDAAVPDAVRLLLEKEREEKEKKEANGDDGSSSDGAEDVLGALVAVGGGRLAARQHNSSKVRAPTLHELFAMSLPQVLPNGKSLRPAEIEAVVDAAGTVVRAPRDAIKCETVMRMVQSDGRLVHQLQACQVMIDICARKTRSIGMTVTCLQMMADVVRNNGVVLQVRRSLAIALATLAGQRRIWPNLLEHMVEPIMTLAESGDNFMLYQMLRGLSDIVSTQKADAALNRCQVLRTISRSLVVRRPEIKMLLALCVRHFASRDIFHSRLFTLGYVHEMRTICLRAEKDEDALLNGPEQQQEKDKGGADEATEDGGAEADGSPLQSPSPARQSPSPARQSPSPARQSPSPARPRQSPAVRRNEAGGRILGAMEYDRALGRLHAATALAVMTPYAEENEMFVDILISCMPSVVEVLRAAPELATCTAVEGFASAGLSDETVARAGHGRKCDAGVIQTLVSEALGRMLDFPRLRTEAMANDAPRELVRVLKRTRSAKCTTAVLVTLHGYASFDANLRVALVGEYGIMGPLVRLVAADAERQPAVVLASVRLIRAIAQTRELHARLLQDAVLVALIRLLGALALVPADELPPEPRTLLTTVLACLTRFAGGPAYRPHLAKASLLELVARFMTADEPDDVRGGACAFFAALAANPDTHMTMVACGVVDAVFDLAQIGTVEPHLIAFVSRMSEPRRPDTCLALLAFVPFLFRIAGMHETAAGLNVSAAAAAAMAAAAPAVGSPSAKSLLRSGPTRHEGRAARALANLMTGCPPEHAPKLSATFVATLLSLARSSRLPGVRADVLTAVAALSQRADVHRILLAVQRGKSQLIDLLEHVVNMIGSRRLAKPSTDGASRVRRPPPDVVGQLRSIAQIYANLSSNRLVHQMIAAGLPVIIHLSTVEKDAAVRHFASVARANLEVTGG